MITKSYYLIENEGEIDINALKLMGATTKDETQIGYFGSGIKYALATALRKEIPVRIFRGDNEIKIETKPVEMRGETFHVMHVDGDATSVTTNMGPDWKPWFILREFYCNALDEGSSDIDLSDEVEGKAGFTRVYIGMTSEMHDIMMDLDHYFSTKRKPKFEFKGLKVYNRCCDDHMIIYRRGVRVFAQLKSLYDYDIQDIEMSEDRTSSIFNIDWKLVGFWKTKATAEMIVAMYGNPDSHEFRFDWDYAVESLSDEWWLALKDKTIIPMEQSGYFADDLSEFHVMLPYKLCKLLHREFGEKLKIRGMFDTKDVIVPTDPSEKEEYLINKAIDFLKHTDFISEIERDMIMVAVMEKGRLGLAHDKKIYLSPELLTLGLKKTVCVIIEEWLHIISKATDRTRAFQDTLIGIVVDTMEEKTGIYL